MTFKIEVDGSIIDKKIKEFITIDIPLLITKIMEKLAIEITIRAQEIVQEHALDLGGFLQSIDYRMYKRKDNIGFRVFDGVHYGKYWEFGTVAHWVPFWNRDGEPILADWARRHGFSDEDMKARRGLMVKIPKLQPFRKAMMHGIMKFHSIIKEEAGKNA